jgi:hypothetical protein
VHCCFGAPDGAAAVSRRGEGAQEAWRSDRLSLSPQGAARHGRTVLSLLTRVSDDVEVVK